MLQDGGDRLQPSGYKNCPGNVGNSEAMEALFYGGMVTDTDVC